MTITETTLRLFPDLQKDGENVWCIIHPKFRGTKQPTNGCAACMALWRSKQEDKPIVIGKRNAPRY